MQAPWLALVGECGRKVVRSGPWAEGVLHGGGWSSYPTYWRAHGSCHSTEEYQNQEL